MSHPELAPARRKQLVIAALREAFARGLRFSCSLTLCRNASQGLGVESGRGAPAAAGGSSSFCTAMAAEVGWPVHSKTASRPNQKVPGASPECGEARVGGGEAWGGVQGLP